jgi:uroporphyrinogen-III synthase
MPKLLVTRPVPDAQDTILRLDALGIEGVAAPLLERVPLPTDLPAADGFAGLVLTSANALRALDERNAVRPYRGLKVFAVGERTAAAARAAGFAEVVAAGGTFGLLVEAIAAARPGGPLFYPAATHQSGDLGQALAPSGVPVVTVPVYEMQAAASLPAAVVAGLGAGAYAGALFYSRRTAATFVGLVAGWLAPAARARLAVLCLSEQVAAPLLAAQFVRVELTDEPSEAAMMALALTFVRAQNRS